MKERILHYHPSCSVVSIPVADGGEGSVDSFLTALGGEKIRVRTKGPWGDEIDSFYGILPDGTAVIEMAASAGLPLVGDRKILRLLRHTELASLSSMPLQKASRSS